MHPIHKAKPKGAKERAKDGQQGQTARVSLASIYGDASGAEEMLARVDGFLAQQHQQVVELETKLRQLNWDNSKMVWIARMNLHLYNRKITEYRALLMPHPKEAKVEVVQQLLSRRKGLLSERNRLIWIIRMNHFEYQDTLAKYRHLMISLSKGIPWDPSKPLPPSSSSADLPDSESLPPTPSSLSSLSSLSEHLRPSSDTALASSTNQSDHRATTPSPAAASTTAGMYPYHSPPPPISPLADLYSRSITSPWTSATPAHSFSIGSLGSLGSFSSLDRPRLPHLDPSSSSSSSSSSRTPFPDFQPTPSPSFQQQQQHSFQQQLHQPAPSPSFLVSSSSSSSSSDTFLRSFSPSSVLHLPRQSPSPSTTPTQTPLGHKRSREIGDQQDPRSFRSFNSSADSSFPHLPLPLPSTISGRPPSFNGKSTE